VRCREHIWDLSFQIGAETTDEVIARHKVREERYQDIPKKPIIKCDTFKVAEEWNIFLTRRN
jgi:hypothetical protein